MRSTNATSVLCCPPLVFNYLSANKYLDLLPLASHRDRLLARDVVRLRLVRTDEQLLDGLDQDRVLLVEAVERLVYATFNQVTNEGRGGGSSGVATEY